MPATEARSRAQSTARQAADSAWVDRLGRLGLAARGVVYVLIGYLALQVATGEHRRTDRKGALATVAEKPFGKGLLVLLAIGFAGYAVWQLAEAAFGRREEQGAKRTGKRIASAAKGAVYAAFAVSTVALVAGSGGGSGDKSVPWTARVLELPLGQELVGLAGAGVVVVGAVLAWRGGRPKFEDELELHRMGQAVRRVAEAVGVAGTVARGVVVALVGGFLVKAAVDFDPKEAKGLDRTLKTVAAEPYGPWLLGAVALGLLAFGVFSFLEARYRRL